MKGTRLDEYGPPDTQLVKLQMELPEAMLSWSDFQQLQFTAVDSAGNRPPSQIFRSRPQISTVINVK